MKKTSWWIPTIFLLLFLLLLGFSYILTRCGFCDAYGPIFHKIYEGTNTDLNASLNELVAANTNVLGNCRLFDYSKIPNSNLEEWLRDSNIAEYNVRYKCDILDFNIDIYKKENSFYVLDYANVPCEGKKLYFSDSSENRRSAWFNTNYLFEYKAIEANLKDHTFCVKLEKKLFGIEGDRCK